MITSHKMSYCDICSPQCSDSKLPVTKSCSFFVCSFSLSPEFWLELEKVISSYARGFSLGKAEMTPPPNPELALKLEHKSL